MINLLKEIGKNSTKVNMVGQRFSIVGKSGILNEAEIEPITNFEEKMKWAINNGHENYLAFLLTQQKKKKIKDLLLNKLVHYLCVL